MKKIWQRKHRPDLYSFHRRVPEVSFQLLKVARPGLKHASERQQSGDLC